MVKKIINDTLCNADGKLSRKSLTMLTSYIVLILLTVLKVCIENQVTLELLSIYVFMATGQSILTYLDKKSPTQ